VTFREIAFGSREYELELRLREEVLRRPLRLTLSEKDLAGEDSQLHFGLFEEDGELAACAAVVAAVPTSPAEARIRQMAVSPDRQRQGLGQRLLEAIETDLKARGYRKLVLNARASAVGFYERLGYKIDGEEFLDLTVPHVRMSKSV